MVDKQIIERLKTDLDFERTKRKSLQADLKAKEQECEELKEQLKRKEEKAICSIGDKTVNINGNEVPFDEIVEKARDYISSIGGFEKLAEWGLR